jgi:hypothetical protein
VRVASLRPEYVEFIPKNLEDGVLYVSRKFQTASHCCCCGCGTKIVTPLRETDYRLATNGNLVSLYPSIGNWNHPCQSHYWIKDGAVVWAAPMTKAQIQAGRAHDDALRQAHFAKVAWPWWRRAISAICAGHAVWHRLFRRPK